MSEKNENKKGRKIWEKVLMGAVIGGAIGSVVGGTVSSSKEAPKEIIPKKKKSIFGRIVGIFSKNKDQISEVKKIPHEHS